MVEKQENNKQLAAAVEVFLKPIQSKKTVLENCFKLK